MNADHLAHCRKRQVKLRRQRAQERPVCRYRQTDKDENKNERSEGDGRNVETFNIGVVIRTFSHHGASSNGSTSDIDSAKWYRPEQSRTNALPTKRGSQILLIAADSPSGTYHPLRTLAATSPVSAGGNPMRCLVRLDQLRTRCHPAILTIPSSPWQLRSQLAYTASMGTSLAPLMFRTLQQKGD